MNIEIYFMSHTLMYQITFEILPQKIKSWATDQQQNKKPFILKHFITHAIKRHILKKISGKNSSIKAQDL